MTCVRNIAAGVAAALLVACSGSAGPAADGGPSVPAAPNGVSATAVIGGATVSWTAPASDGGSALQGYRLAISPAVASAQVSVSATTASVTGLANGATYTFSVSAYNAIGDGPPSAPSNAVTTPDVPGAPVGVIAVAGDQTVTLAWTSPATNGGRPVTAYQVAIHPSTPSAQVNVNGTSATVTGLANGTSYTFTVAAVNAVGTGPASLPSSAVTPTAAPPGAPGAPTSVIASATVGGAMLSWAAPASSGTSPIQGYTVSVLPAPGSPPSINVSGTTATIAGLAAGTAYAFSVAAFNASGTGPPALSNAVTTPTLPGAPTGVNAVASNQSASLSWTAPASNGGSPVTSYLVAISPPAPGAQVKVNGTTATVTSLTNGTTYTFTVAAVNAVGTGPASAPSAPVTPQANGTASPTLVQSFAFGANVQSRGLLDSHYTFAVPNLWGAGNCVVVIIDMTHGNSVSSLVDDAGNSWPTTPAVSADQGSSSSMLSNVYVLPNVHAGGSKFTLDLASGDDNLKLMVLELSGVATGSPVGVTSQSHTASAPSVSAPMLSPAAGNLVLHYGLDASDRFGLGTPVASITAGAGWTLLHADFADDDNPSMNWYALQWRLAPGGSITPTFTTTGNNRVNTWALELKASTGAGTAPGAGIHINKVQVFTQINITQSTFKVPFPTTGNLTAVIEDEGSLRALPSDSTGNSWALPVVGDHAPVSALAYAKNVTPSQTNVITFPVSDLPANTSYFVFDVSGAEPTAPLQQTVTFPVAVEGTSWTDTCKITPKKQGSLVLNYAGTGIGPIRTETSPTGAAFLAVDYPSKTDQDTFDNANAMSTYYVGTSLATLHFGYAMDFGTTINATAAEFSAAP